MANEIQIDDYILSKAKKRLQKLQFTTCLFEQIDDKSNLNEGLWLRYTKKWRSNTLCM